MSNHNHVQSIEKPQAHARWKIMDNEHPIKIYMHVYLWILNLNSIRTWKAKTHQFTLHEFHLILLVFTEVTSLNSIAFIESQILLAKEYLPRACCMLLQCCRSVLWLHLIKTQFDLFCVRFAFYLNISPDYKFCTRIFLPFTYLFIFMRLGAWQVHRACSHAWRCKHIVLE